MRVWLSAIAAAALAACGSPTPPPAAEKTETPAALPGAATQLGLLSLSEAAVRAPLPGATNTAAYLTIENGGAGADRLVSAASPAAEKIELHTHVDDNGVMRMRQVEAIDVPAGAATRLQPGGLHLMLFGVSAVSGEVPIRLTFEKAGVVEVPFTVIDGAPKPTDAPHSH